MEIDNLLNLPNHLFQTTEAGLVEQVTRARRDGAPIFGQFSILHTDPHYVWLIRDRLGINKLFYVLDHARHHLTVGNSIFEVSSVTHDFNRVMSVPPGHFLRIDRHNLATELVSYYDLSGTTTSSPEEFSLPDFHLRVSRRLEEYFSCLAENHPEATFTVCLSGGLDSTVVATYAKRFLKNVFATTFSYAVNGKESDDFVAARSIADALKLDFHPIVRERVLDQGRLDTILRHCQDWRDFNVHCAWLNDQVGEALRVRQPAGALMVLTGDLMNEYVADYTPVTYRDAVYYPQPRISRERLRRFFIYGLDTSDREVGIFHRHGITTIQPYSILAEEYLQVPATIIEQPQCKERLNLPLIGNPEVESLVGRAKTRAQVGGKEGGVLGLFHDSGVTQAALKERWEQLFAPFCREGKPREVIVSGRYRSEN